MTQSTFIIIQQTPMQQVVIFFFKLHIYIKPVFSENFVDEGVGLNTSKKPRKSFDTGDLMALDKQPQQPRIK